jgi:hypothetical protein
MKSIMMPIHQRLKCPIDNRLRQRKRAHDLLFPTVEIKPDFSHREPALFRTLPFDQHLEEVGELDETQTALRDARCAG